MRLKILNNGFGLGTKILFKIIRIFSGYPVPDAAKIIFYRPDFYGSQMKKFTHQVMRGTSSWTVAERELMAAFISKLNECSFCIGAHTATAVLGYKDNSIVDAVLSNPNTAPINEPLKATLGMLGKLTLNQSIETNDMKKVLDTGVSTNQIMDALNVCFAFNVTNRLADAFGFYVPNSKAFESGAKYLLKHGYR
jgi:uncharacterized peroxidase-related enzyme